MWHGCRVVGQEGQWGPGRRGKATTGKAYRKEGQQAQQGEGQRLWWGWGQGGQIGKLGQGAGMAVVGAGNRGLVRGLQAVCVQAEGWDRQGRGWG